MADRAVGAAGARSRWLRELEKLADEHVMGRQWRPCPHPPMVFCSCRSLPRYARSIADAWRLVEKMEADKYTLELYSPGALIDDEFGAHADEWEAHFVGWERDDFGSGEKEAPTAPLAITLAALRAVGADIPPEPEEAGS